jgi:hypothetical protein
MKTSHELPIALLPYSYKWNDFEYCLPKFLSISEYKNHYINARKDGRFIILDNGLFEGETYTEKQLISFINEIEPDIFISPDEWNDAESTYNKAVRWKSLEPLLPERTKLMAVIQAKDMGDVVNLYEKLNLLGYKYISFNHSLDLYKELFPHKNKLVSQMMGRIFLINYLDSLGIINHDINHHLLGCSLPQEFTYYSGYDYITSVDTSNPIIHGALGIEYEDYGLYSKSSVKLEDILLRNDFSSHFGFITLNINKFKQYCK